jgi:hypothetical protein
MNNRRFVSFCAVAMAILSATPAGAQTRPTNQAWTVPLTPNGHPDLIGTWLDSSATPLERPKELAGRQFLTDAEVLELKKRADRLFKSDKGDYAAGDNVFLAALANPDRFTNPNATCKSDVTPEREFDNRTSLIVDPPDGRIPPFTPEAKSRQSALRNAVAAGVSPPDGPEDLNAAIRCITPGVPRLGGRYGAGDYGYYQIAQTPDHVVLFNEIMHQTRIIPLDGRPHLPASIRTWDGDSRGRWDGKTLVVDTTNFSAKSNFMGSSENLHLTERFTRIAADEIRYEVTMDDPTVWTRPWTVMVRLRRTEEKLYENACHEGNLPLEDILTGARAQEKAAEDAAAKRAK